MNVPGRNVTSDTPPGWPPGWVCPHTAVWAPRSTPAGGHSCSPPLTHCDTPPSCPHWEHWHPAQGIQMGSGKWYEVNSCSSIALSLILSLIFMTRRRQDKLLVHHLDPAPCVRTPGWSWSRTLACRRSCTASPPPCGTPACSQSGAPSCTPEQSTPLARSCTPPGTGWCTPRPGHPHTPPPPHPVSQVNMSLSLVSPT